MGQICRLVRCVFEMRTRRIHAVARPCFPARARQRLGAIARRSRRTALADVIGRLIKTGTVRIDAASRAVIVRAMRIDAIAGTMIVRAMMAGAEARLRISRMARRLADAVSRRRIYAAARRRRCSEGLREIFCADARAHEEMRILRSAEIFLRCDKFGSFRRRCREARQIANQSQRSQ